MKNYFIVIPVYNDNKSLNKLLIKLNKYLFFLKKKITILIINNCSKKSIIIKNKFKNFKKIKIINLKKNVGSQKAIFICLKYLKKIKKKFNISIIDSDGEDNPKNLKKLIDISLKKNDSIVVANRSKRTESLLLRFLNKIRLVITYILTGNYINFGNFSSFSSTNLVKILGNNNLWLAYSGGIKKNVNKIIYLNTNKNKRYFGKSKVNFKFLLIHSIKIICIFKNQIFFRSIILILFLFFITKNNLFIILSLLILFLNLIIFLFYKFNDLVFDSQKLIKNIKVISSNH